MRDRELILAELRHAHDGDPWHGPSRAAVLRDVTVDDARRRPEGGAHSIWELVQHMRAWTREVARRVREGAPGQPAEGDFPPVTGTTEHDWRATLESLSQAHEELLAAVSAMRDVRLDEKVGTTAADVAAGPGVTYRAMLHGLTQHDAYHTGQIAILEKLYRGTTGPAATR